MNNYSFNLNKINIYRLKIYLQKKFLTLNMICGKTKCIRNHKGTLEGFLIKKFRVFLF